MAEQTKEAEVAPHAVMSEAEASKLQREIILNAGNPDYAMPDGRTNKEIWDARARQDEADRKEADEFERRSLAANTPRVAEVELRVEEGGNVVATPKAETPAATQLVVDEKEGGGKHIAGDELPDDFPGYAALVEADYKLRSQVDALGRDELLAVPGIGDKTVEKILEQRAPGGGGGAP